jgi:hypothetical protein
MKKLVLSIGLIVLSLFVKAQMRIEKQFQSIWQNHRIQNGLTKPNCNFQEFSTVKIKPDTSVYVYFSEGKDTTYGYYVLTGDEKITQKYHDKNTRFIFSAEIDTIWDISNYFTEKSDTNYNILSEMIYQDSVILEQLYLKICNNPIKKAIMDSSLNFVLLVNDKKELDGLKASYVIDLYEILDVSAFNLPEYYGSTIRHNDDTDIKATMVDPKTKKLLYPELTKKMNRELRN